MGGEIEIVDKEIGEKGTCFRFNTFLTTCDNVASEHNTKEEETETQGGGQATSNYPHGSLRIQTNRNSGINILPSPRASPRAEGSQVIMLMQSEERRKITQKLFETRGIKISVVKEWERFSHALKRIRRKESISYLSSSGISDFSPRSFRSGSSSNAGAKDIPLSAMDGTDRTVPTPKRKGMPRFILILIEATAGPLPELCRAVAEFRKDLNNTCCRVVWLDKPTIRTVQGDMVSPNDLVILKPFHGSRLYQVAKLLPEFGGPLLGVSSSSPPRKSPSRIHLEVRKSEIQEVGSSSDQKPLMGKRVLIAEDNMVLCKLATVHVTRLGATVEACDNGAKTVQLVCNGMRDNMINNAFMIPPYDFILMDCEVYFTFSFSISSTYHKFNFLKRVLIIQSIFLSEKIRVSYIYNQFVIKKSLACM